MGLTGEISVDVAATLSGEPDIGEANYKVFDKYIHKLRDQPNSGIFADRFIISGAGSKTYDVAGDLIDGLGRGIRFSGINSLLIFNEGDAEITYGGGANALAAFLGAKSHTVRIPPKGSSRRARVAGALVRLPHGIHRQ